ncbi:MAG: TerB family tellurite resistance protein [Bacteroidales bacterium]|nr:TerB family tellurite resistance protein [Bacteroidales bacterium]
MSNLPNDKKIKLEHFANLVAVAYSDGYLEEHEKEFLSERAEEYGLPANEVKKLFDMAAELKFIVPQNDEEKEEQLSDAVYMAMIDGKVHEKEYDLCLTIAEKLDFRKKDLDYVIELTKKLWK